jgi:hypothetical protein
VRTAIPTFIMKDKLETPYLTAYAIALLCFAILVRNRRSTSQLKSIFFWTFFTIMLAIRCLSSFSGHLHPEIGFWGEFWYYFPISASSPYKAVFLHWMIGLRCWDWTILGRYRDSSEDTGSTDCASAVNAKSESTSPPVSWRDAMVRMAYYHVIDNTIHMMWLRFSWTYGYPLSYTSYINNSEILTLLLLAQMVAWSLMEYHMRDRLLVEAITEVEEGHRHEKLHMYEKSG